MKKFLIQLFTTALLAYIFGMFLPWWSVAVVAFAIAMLINAHSFLSFLAGLLALGGLWFGLAYSIHHSTQGILSDKMAIIIGFASSGFQLALFTAVIGAILGGLSALSGVYLRKIFSS